MMQPSWQRHRLISVPWLANSLPWLLSCPAC